MRSIAFVLSLVATTAACGRAGHAPDAGASPVNAAVVDATVVEAREAAVTQTFEAGGAVKARVTTSIASRVMAPVVEVMVRPGDQVRAGQHLVVLDGRDLQAHREQAAATVTASEQALSAAQAESRASSAALVLATAAHGRIDSLRASQAATAQELDEAVATLRAAEGRAAAGDARVAEATAGLAAARASAAAAAITASYATIDAPFTGTIAERTIEPGSMALPGAPLMTIEDVTSARLEVRLDADRASSVAVGQQVSVQCDDRTDRWNDGRVVEISRIEPSSHGFLVKIDCPTGDSARSGGFGRARFAQESVPTLTVPASSVVRRGQLTLVFVVDDSGIARLRPVATGRTIDARVEIVAGLANGERVIDTPPPSLIEGSRIAGTAPGSSPAARTSGAGR